MARPFAGRVRRRTDRRRPAVERVDRCRSARTWVRRPAGQRDRRRRRVDGIRIAVGPPRSTADRPGRHHMVPDADHDATRSLRPSPRASRRGDEQKPFDAADDCRRSPRGPVPRWCSRGASPRPDRRCRPRLARRASITRHDADDRRGASARWRGDQHVAWARHLGLHRSHQRRRRRAPCGSRSRRHHGHAPVQRDERPSSPHARRCCVGAHQLHGLGLDHRRRCARTSANAAARVPRART